MRLPKITFCGGVEEVTGANFLFEVPDGGDKTVKILIDCGLTQGTKSMEEKNRRTFIYNPSEIDFLFITHAHMDHIGKVPKLVRDGFGGKIISTRATRELSVPMLDDALNIQEEESRREGVLPLYEKKDIERAFLLWETVDYDADRDLGRGFRVLAKDAGHVLGSAMYQFTVLEEDYDEGKRAQRETKVLFTGDLGNSPSPLLKDTENISGIDYLVMESVYGDRNHEDAGRRYEMFRDVVRKAVNKKGTLIVPIFSLEKTQVMLYELKRMVEKNEIPLVPVFLDSPLAIKITEIYKQNAGLFNEEARNAMHKYGDLLNFPKLHFTPSHMQSENIESTPAPKIILAGSGMSTGGRIKEHERNYLGDPKNTILFVGYQSAGTLGRQIEEGVRKVSINGETVTVRAEVAKINGYSSHKDLDHLVSFVEEAAETLKKVFVVMGEPKASMFLCQRLKDYLGVEAIHPEEGESVEIE